MKSADTAPAKVAPLPQALPQDLDPLQLLHLMAAPLLVLRLTHTEAGTTLRLVYANQAWVSQTDKTSAELVGKDFQEIFPTLTKRGVEDLLLESLANQRNLSFEEIEYYREVLKIEHSYLIKGFPLNSQDLGLIFENTTELKQAEAELLKTTDQLEKALAQLKNATDRLIVSEKMAALGKLIAGVAHEMNTPVSAVLASVRNARRLVAETFEALMLQESELPSESRPTLRDAVDKTLRMPLGHHNMTTAEERLQRQAIALELREMGIENAESLARSFIESGLWERVQEILPALPTEWRGRVGESLADLAQLRLNLEGVEIAADKAGRVVQALRSYAYIQEEDRQVLVNLSESVENVLTVYHNAMKRGVEVSRDYADLPPIPVYPDQISQVWSNLIANARHAMRDRGRLHVRTYMQDGRACIEFTDSGPGVDPTMVEKIFDPFFTTKNQGEGTGLGLDICRRIVEKHLGTIQLTHTEPGRTSFTISLPLKPVNPKAKLELLNLAKRKVSSTRKDAQS